MCASRRPPSASASTWPRWQTSARAHTALPAEIAGRLGKRASYTSAPRDSLIKKGLIYSPDYGQVDFTVPKFSPFMRRRYPLELT